MRATCAHQRFKPREVTSLTEVSASPWGATNDPIRLPELRHNLRIIVESSKTELDGLAREAKALQERRKWVQDEDARLRKVVSQEAERKCCTRIPSLSMILIR